MSRTAAAAEANRQMGAERAAKNPERLSKALRTVRTAVAIETLTLDDLIRETVDSMPEMSASTRAQLTALLGGTDSATAA